MPTMLLLYWEIGRELAKRQQQRRMGRRRLAPVGRPFAQRIADVKGFSLAQS